jgi:hypothetical protein
LSVTPKQRCKEIGITALHIKIRATGGVGTKTPGPLRRVESVGTGVTSSLQSAQESESASM